MARRRLVAVFLAGALLIGPSPAGAIEPPIADAARAGDLEVVRERLRAGNDVNAAHNDGMTALHWAALHGDRAMAEMLLYAGANLHATTRIGAHTPLLIASRHGHTDVIEALLASGADPDLASETGTTPLMFAAASGIGDAVQALLAGGADPDVVERSHGQTALMFAAAGNAVDAIDLLADVGATVETVSRVVDIAELENAAREASRRKARIAAAIAAVDAPPEREDSVAEKATAELKGDDGDDKPATVPEAEPHEVAPEQGENVVSLSEAAAAELQSRQVAVPGERAEIAAREEAVVETTPDEERPRADPPPGRLSYGELVGSYGGMTALHHAARQGHFEAVQALLELGADVNQITAGDSTSPLLISVINGHFDLAMYLLEQGADPTLASAAGATPLYAALNVQWAPKTLYPQPRAYGQQRHTHLELMRALLGAGADPNVRLRKKIWYSGYNFDLSGVNEVGGTPFWRAAYGSDVPAMRLLVEYGADPTIPTTKPPGRPRTGDATREIEDASGLAPVPVGGPAVPPLHAASGVGYGEGFAANSHRNAPGAWLEAVRYLVQECGADVNAVDHEGNTALHHAAARGDNEMILYLVEHGADVTAVNREGNTTADMANGPVQRTQPFPETVELLVSLGAVNNDKCVSC